MKDRITNRPETITLRVQGGEEYCVRLIIECGPNIGSAQALVQFDFIDANEFDPSSMGLTRSSMEHIGYFKYIQTKPGVSEFEHRITIPDGTTEMTVGVRSWSAFDLIRLLDFTVLYQSGEAKSSIRGGGALSLMSVDVEALQGRSTDDHVNRLIHGRFDGRDHGIARLCDLFDEFGAKATFFVDFAACSVYGDKPIFEAAALIEARGHDVQLHVHPDALIRVQGWAHDILSLPSFANMDYSTALRVLDYCVRKFEACLGRTPTVFRPGAMTKSPSLYMAAKECGIKAVSTIFRNYDMHFWNRAARSGYFRWQNGILEIPLDIGLDPLVGKVRVGEVYTNLVNQKYRKYLSFLLHSTSLLHRDQSQLSVFERYEPRHEEVLRETMDILRSRGGFATHAQIAERGLALNNLPAHSFTPYPERMEWQVGQPEEVRTCNLCLTPFLQRLLKDDVCPYCGARVRHRVLKTVLDNNTGNLFEGRVVCANNASPLEVEKFLADSDVLVNFDVRPLEYTDMVADVQNLDCFEDARFDAFYSIYVLNHVADDRKALKEMRRVLKPDGIAVVMAPLGQDEHTSEMEDVTCHYGAQALERYGVGSYRDYSHNDFVSLLGEFFEVNHISEIDDLTGVRDTVFVCRPK